MNTKTKRYIAISLTTIVSLIMTAGAFAKVLKVQAVVDSFTKIGVGEYTQILGLFELVFIALYLIPRTMKIGFLLLCSYLGGAIATHLSHHEDFFQPVIPLALIWVTAFLRDGSLFYSKQGKFVNEP